MGVEIEAAVGQDTDSTIEADIERLIELLEKQLGAARAGRLGELEELAGQSDSLVRRIGDSGVLMQDDFREMKDKIERLYREIFIILADKKMDISQQIDEIRRGRRVIRAYRNNL